MVLFDATKVVKIVDHEAGGLVQALVAQIRRPMNGVEAGAIAQMEPRDGIQRVIRWPSLIHQIPGAQCERVLLLGLRRVNALHPRGGSELVHIHVQLILLFIEPLAKAWDR